MTKRKRQHRATPSATEQETTTRGHRSRRGATRCNLGFYHAIDDRSRAERTFSTACHDLAAYFTFHTRHGQADGRPGVDDKFMAWLDNARTPRAEKWAQAREEVKAFALRHAALAGIVVAIGGQGRSAREVAEELYGPAWRAEDEPRIEAAALRGRTVLVELLDRLGFYLPGA